MISYEPKNQSIFRTTERKDGYITGFQDGMRLSEDRNGVRIIGGGPIDINNYRAIQQAYNGREKSF